MLTAVVCIRCCNCCCQHDIRQRFCHQRSLLSQYRLCLFGSPHLQARRRQQRTGAADTMIKSCSGRRLKRSILVHIVLNKKAFFCRWPKPDSFWREQESGRFQRNLEESGVNTGIPVPQEFLQKIPVKTGKNRNSRDPLQNHVPVKNSSGKCREKDILGNPGRNGFLGPKKYS